MHNALIRIYKWMLYKCRAHKFGGIPCFHYWRTLNYSIIVAVLSIHTRKKKKMLQFPSSVGWKRNQWNFISVAFFSVGHVIPSQKQLVRFSNWYIFVEPRIRKMETKHFVAWIYFMAHGIFSVIMQCKPAFLIFRFCFL